MNASTTARMPRLRHLLAVAAASALLVSGVIVGDPRALHAVAADYPSWDDVLGARDSEVAKAEEIARLEGLIAALKAEVKVKEADAKKKGDAYFAAQQTYDEAAFKAEQLQAQADIARETANESIRQAGQLAARTQRAGGSDVTATLLFGEGDSDNLLGHLSMAAKVNERSNGVFARARQDQNTAQALTDQANVAKGALEELALAAEKKMAVSQKAADAAMAAFEEQREHQARLQAQLASLKEDRIATEAEYTAGIKALWGDGATGQVSSTGWARPSGGHMSSGYGWRVPPRGGASSLHGGIDLAPACNAPIFAAHSGTVEYAGWNGGYGYYVRVDHGNGLSTAYGHIVAGGIRVSPGDRVGPGQLIAHVGTTGVSTGCHLHFEVRLGGGTTDPAAYLRNNGVSL